MGSQGQGPQGGHHAGEEQEAELGHPGLHRAGQGQGQDAAADGLLPAAQLTPVQMQEGAAGEQGAHRQEAAQGARRGRADPRAQESQARQGARPKDEQVAGQDVPAVHDQGVPHGRAGVPRPPHDPVGHHHGEAEDRGPQDHLQVARALGHHLGIPAHEPQVARDGRDEQQGDPRGEEQAEQDGLGPHPARVRPAIRAPGLGHQRGGGHSQGPEEGGEQVHERPGQAHRGQGGRVLEPADHQGVAEEDHGLEQVLHHRGQGQLEDAPVQGGAEERGQKVGTPRSVATWKKRTSRAVQKAIQPSSVVRRCSTSRGWTPGRTWRGMR